MGDRIRDALDGSERTQALTDIGNGEGYAGNMLGGKTVTEEVKNFERSGARA